MNMLQWILIGLIGWVFIICAMLACFGNPKDEEM
jgi:hypothetical protein